MSRVVERRVWLFNIAAAREHEMTLSPLDQRPQFACVYSNATANLGLRRQFAGVLEGVQGIEVARQGSIQVGEPG